MWSVKNIVCAVVWTILLFLHVQKRAVFARAETEETDKRPQTSAKIQELSNWHQKT